MTRHALRAVLVVAACVASSGSAHAQPQGSRLAREHVSRARAEGNYTFCSQPKLPLRMEQRELCGLAAELEGCEALVAACKGEPLEKKESASSTWAALKEALAALARILVWLLVAFVLAAIGAPLVLALLRARRNRAVADEPRAPNVATATVRARPPEPETIGDAESALRDADDHARRGELTRALGLYLAASLAALDRRGAIRLARHRTNGEYVRACAGDPSCWPLRDIVREVDRVEFGKVPPTPEAVANVAARATALVRGGRSGGASRAVTGLATGALLLLAVLSMGCSGGPRKPGVANDPAGDELPMDVLRRSGYDVAYLSTSLTALPVPAAADAHVPVLVIDVERVTLEDESSAHVMRWVSEGGVLVLFGSPASWPDELKATQGHAANDQVDVLTTEVYARGARVGGQRVVTLPGGESVAFIGGNGVYAAHKSHGKGAVLGVAGRELFTNVGVARPDNAGALAALLDVAMSDRTATEEDRGLTEPATTFEVRVARRDDGIPPPSNPFSALVQAGLGRGAWHALAATLVLFLAYGVRHARPRPAAPPARRAFAEHVQATGAFYGRARALGHALASYGRYAEIRLRERVARGTDPVQFLAARTQTPPEEVARIWKRATEANADDPPRGDELTTIRDLGALLEKALETTG